MLGLPIEHYQQDTAAWRKAEQPGFCKAVGFQFSIFECTDLVLIFLGITIQCRKIQIRRSLRDVEIVMICLEKVMNDQRCPVKEYTGHLIRVRREFLASHDTVEDNPGIR